MAKKKKKYNTERIKQIIRQISGKFDEESLQNDLISSAMVDGSGEIWCWSPEKREFIKINRGTKIYIIDFEKDNKNRLMVYDGSNIFLIDEEEIVEIGFN
jgi:hypothetical protein